MVSARLTVVPQMALISSGSSEGAAGAERVGAALDIGTSRWVPSELRLSGSVFLTICRRTRRADAVGDGKRRVDVSTTVFRSLWNELTPKRLDEVQIDVNTMCDTYDGKSRGRNLLDLLTRVIRRVCGVFSLGKSLETQ